MAVNTKGITLKRGTSASALTKLCPINGIPDMGGKPDFLDTTSCDDGRKVGIPGIENSNELEFETNWDAAVLTTLNSSAKITGYYALEDAAGNKYEWQGQHVAYEKSAAVNAVRKIAVVIYPSTDISFTKATA